MTLQDSFLPDLITLENVEFGFQQPLIQIENLVLKVGQKVALVGVSGSGKSTLLRLMVGFLKPQKGVITRNFQRKEWGWVFQTPNVIPWLSVGQNLQLVTHNFHQAYHQWSQWAPLFGLDPALWHKPAGYLSGGQKMRLNFLRALIIPRIRLLLLDEPLQGVDPINRRQIIESLMVWAQENPQLSWIWITHHQDEFELHSLSWVMRPTASLAHKVESRSLTAQTRLIDILEGS